MENVREHEAASCFRGYHIYRDFWTAVIGATFLHSTELRNEEVKLSQDRTVPSFTVKEIISSFNYSLSQVTMNFFF